MQSLNMQTLSQSYGLYRQLSANIFNYLNRKINILIPCDHMEFMGESLNKVTRSYILGMNFADVIIISLLDIFHCAEEAQLIYEEELKGLLIYVIAHELSHLDQKIPFRLVKIDEAVKKQIENANDSNTLHFLFNNKQELERFFGPISFEGVRRIGKTEDNIYLYRRVSSWQEKILDILEYMIDNNNRSLMQVLTNNNHQNLEIHYTNFSANYSIVHKVIENGRWLSYNDTMGFLRNNLTIKDFVKSCVWEDNGIVKLIITKSNNPISYPINCVLNPGDKVLIPVL